MDQEEEELENFQRGLMTEQERQIFLKKQYAIQKMEMRKDDIINKVSEELSGLLR